MKKLIDTIKNIFKIEELRNRIGYTILLLLIYRLGSFVVVPGIDPTQLANLEAQTQDGLMGLLNMFSGGAFGNASIFALGVMPYISASIVIQLLGIMIPYFQRLQREGESGRRKMNQWTRYLTIVILALQGPAYLTNLHTQLPETAFLIKGFSFNLFATIVLIGGTMFIMWLGERITDRGLGNGISLIIMVGIIARLPFALTAEIGTRLSQTTGGLLMLIVEIIILFFVFVATIALVQGTRKIPVQYAKRIIGNKQYGGVRQYIPLKVNAAGVMPIIFASSIMSLPSIVIAIVGKTPSGIAGEIVNVLNTANWLNPTKPIYSTNDVIFDSSNESIISVDQNGYLIAQSTGTATITVYSALDKNIFRTITISVVEPTPTNIIISGKDNMKQGEYQYLETEVIGQNVTKEVTYESSDNRICIVYNGIVLAVNKGTAIIKVKSVVDESIYDEITINVSKLDSMEISKEVFIAFVWYL